jgi:hypothetical protein
MLCPIGMHSDNYNPPRNGDILVANHSQPWPTGRALPFVTLYIASNFPKATPSLIALPLNIRWDRQDWKPCDKELTALQKADIAWETQRRESWPYSIRKTPAQQENVWNSAAEEIEAQGE